MQLVRVAQIGELQKGAGKVVNAGGDVIAVFRVGDDYFATSNFCLHRGGPLGEGTLFDYTVTCPWHGWTYDVRTGSFDLIPPLKVKTYPVKVQGTEIFVEV